MLLLGVVTREEREKPNDSKATNQPTADNEISSSALFLF